jgi:hypothetical protein
MIRPLSKLSLLLKNLHKLQQAIFKFECEGIEFFKTLKGDLISLFVGKSPETDSPNEPNPI